MRCACPTSRRGRRTSSPGSRATRRLAAAVSQRRRRLHIRGRAARLPRRGVARALAGRDGRRRPPPGAPVLHRAGDDGTRDRGGRRRARRRRDGADGRRPAGAGAMEPPPDLRGGASGGRLHDRDVGRFRHGRRLLRPGGQSAATGRNGDVAHRARQGGAVRFEPPQGPGRIARLSQRLQPGLGRAASARRHHRRRAFVGRRPLPLCLALVRACRQPRCALAWPCAPDRRRAQHLLARHGPCRYRPTGRAAADARAWGRHRHDASPPRVSTEGPVRGVDAGGRAMCERDQR